MTTKIKLLAGALALALLFAGLLHLKALRADNLRLAEEAAQAGRQAAAYQMEAEANHEALEKREAGLKQLAAETETLKRELEALYANNPEARAWACDALPDCVLDRLRD